MFGHGLVQSTFYGTVSLIQAFLRVRLIPSVSIIPEVFHTHSQPHANLTSGTNDEDWEPPTTKKKGGGEYPLSEIWDYWVQQYFTCFFAFRTLD